MSAEPFSAEQLTEKRRYIASRNTARDHWGAGELAHIDHEARWLATLDDELDRLADALREMGAERDQLFKLSLHFERALHHIAVTLSSLDAIQAYAQIALADAVLGAVSGTEGGER